MADNILDAARQRESPQAAKRMRLDTDHEDGSSVPLSSLDAEGFVDPHHPNKLLEGLNRLRLNSVLCDVILCCEGEEVPCHRHVLASFSPYFEAMFTSGMRESTQDRVTISGVEPQMIGLLVNYAYTSEVSISSDNVQALLAASDLLEVTSVREACCEYMKRHMDVHNCVEFYCSADDHSCEMLKKHGLDHMLEHFSVLYQKEEFLSLSVERLTEVLCSDHLNVPEEDMVFEAAMLWLDKSPTRKQSFGQVLEHIRLPLISPSYLHSSVVESLDVLKEQQGCQRFISEAKGEQPYSNTARLRISMTTEVIVMLGGYETLNNPFHNVESFNPLTSQRKTLGILPSKINSYAVCASGSSLYVAGGKVHHKAEHEDDLSREMWRYDVHHSSWLEMAPMNEPRLHCSLVMLDGCVFAVGGQGSEKSEDSMEKYDPHTDSWRLMESVGVAEHYEPYKHKVVALDGHLYFIGGATDAKYNPKTSVWTEVAAMDIPSSASCVLNGKIYATGGACYDDYDMEWIGANTMQRYDPQTNQWTMCARMREGRYSHSAVTANGKIYVLGGCTGYRPVDHDIECYCEETDTWETVCPNEPLVLVHDHVMCVSVRVRTGLKIDATVDDEFSEDDYVYCEADYPDDYYLDYPDV